MLKRNHRLIIELAIILPIFVSLSFASPAHVFHTTLTRIDFNANEKLAEISIQMFTHDVAPTIEKLTNKRFDREKSKEVEDLLFDYVSKHFVLKDSNGETRELKWVGMELEADTVFVYLETEIPAGLNKATLQNSLFFEYFAEQINLVVCKSNTKKADLAFKVGDQAKELLFEEK